MLSISMNHRLLPLPRYLAKPYAAKADDSSVPTTVNTPMIRLFMYIWPKFSVSKISL
ncbi:hypothetical protein VQ056_06290 [Paenibacillus sp. JTLBN-2024]